MKLVINSHKKNYTYALLTKLFAYPIGIALHGLNYLLKLLSPKLVSSLKIAKKNLNLDYSTTIHINNFPGQITQVTTEGEARIEIIGPKFYIDNLHLSRTLNQAELEHQSKRLGIVFGKFIIKTTFFASKISMRIFIPTQNIPTNNSVPILKDIQDLTFESFLKITNSHPSKVATNHNLDMNLAPIIIENKKAKKKITFEDVLKWGHHNN
jgi:hypothetical protein